MKIQPSMPSFQIKTDALHFPGSDGRENRPKGNERYYVVCLGHGSVHGHPLYLHILALLLFDYVFRVLFSSSSLCSTMYFSKASGLLCTAMHSFSALEWCRQLNTTINPCSSAQSANLRMCWEHLSRAMSLNSRRIWCSAKLRKESRPSLPASFIRALASALASGVAFGGDDDIYFLSVFTLLSLHRLLPCEVAIR